jgi:hypothetical protein
VRLARIALALVLLAPLAGCIDDDERLSLERDGSGHLRVEATVDLSFLDQLRQATGGDAEGDGAFKSLLDPEKIRKDCDAKGVTVKTCEVEEAGPKKTRLKLAIDFTDLEALRATRFMADREIELVEAGDDVELVYRFDPRRWGRLLGVETDGKPPRGDADKKARAAIEGARDAAGARFAIALPGKVAATNGEKKGEAEVRWKLARSESKATFEPLEMRAKLAKSDVPFWEKEVARQKEKRAAASPPPGAPAGK